MPDHLRPACSLDCDRLTARSVCLFGDVKSHTFCNSRLVPTIVCSSEADNMFICRLLFSFIAGTRARVHALTLSLSHRHTHVAEFRRYTRLTASSGPSSDHLGTGHASGRWTLSLGWDASTKLRKGYFAHASEPKLRRHFLLKSSRWYFPQSL